MALHLYKGGTEGLMDGEPLSTGDMTNPLIFSGYDIDTGDVSYAQFAKLYLRADAGEEWVGVCLKIADVSSSEDLHDILLYGRGIVSNSNNSQNGIELTLPNSDRILTANYQGGAVYTNTSYTMGTYALMFPYVGDTNSSDCILCLSPLLYVGLKDPQTNIKIIVTSGVKNE